MAYKGRKGSRTTSGHRLGKAVATCLDKEYGPLGFVLEPCRGSGNIYDYLPGVEGVDKDWCEITLKRDFLAYAGPVVRWIVTNPPWPPDQYNAIFKQSLRWGINIVYIVPLKTALGYTARNQLWHKAGFGLRTIIMLGPDLVPDGFNAGGNQQSIVHWQRGYRGRPEILWWD